MFIIGADKCQNIVVNSTNVENFSLIGDKIFAYLSNGNDIILADYEGNYWAAEYAFNLLIMNLGENDQMLYRLPAKCEISKKNVEDADC